MLGLDFTDRLFTSQEIIANGNKAVTRTSLPGLQSGKWHDHAPTGEPMETSRLLVERIVDGKVVEH
jgi:predicted ester cyclase